MCAVRGALFGGISKRSTLSAIATEGQAVLAMETDQGPARPGSQSAVPITEARGGYANLEAEQLRLWYHTWGTEGATPVLFVHGGLVIMKSRSPNPAGHKIS